MVPHKVAVAIPTYKREELLRRLIGSVPTDWDIYVSDNDASIKPLVTPLPGIVSHSPILIPMFANWNRALSLVEPSATHVFIPSDDDLFLPNAVDVVHRALAQHPEADIFIFGCDFFDEHDKIWPGYRAAALRVYEPGDGFHVFSRGVDARMPGVLLRRSFLERIGAFDERFELTAADSDLIQRSLLMGRSVFVPETIGLYRVWTGSLTHARVASDQWMREIDLWVDKIASMLDAGHQLAHPIDVPRFKDEIYISNLRSGIHALKRQGRYLSAWSHAFSRRYPYRASLISQAKLFVHLLLPRRR
jgi:hypothetical protein